MQRKITTKPQNLRNINTKDSLKDNLLNQKENHLIPEDVITVAGKIT